MSTISNQTLTARVDVRPYTGLTAIQRQQSGIARAQISLVWDQTTLTSTSSGELKGLVLEGELPRNFAYVYYGGSIEIGRLAGAAVENVSTGCFFENTINATINNFDASQQDSWTLEVAGVQKVELDVSLKNVAGTLTFVAPAEQAASSVTNHATPGIYDPYSDLYKKIYNDVDPPKVIYRAEDGEVTVRARVANMTQDPFPSASYIALGRMHFLQYDIDQAYNYLIHSPIPVR